MKSTKFFAIALMSITLIGLELVWTRIFSGEFFYTFAFLILSLAILGLGLGALALHLFPRLDSQKSLGIVLSLSGLMALISPPAVLHLGLQFSSLMSSWVMVGKFILTIVLLSASFFFGGIGLAILFKNNYEEMPKLYMADLLGAGLGGAIAIILMNSFGTPTTVFVMAAPILLAALMVSPGWLKAFPAVFAALLIGLNFNPAELLTVDREERAPVIYTHWDAMSKIKIYEFSDNYRGINIDNAANSPVERFDGSWDRPDSMRLEFAIDVSYLINRSDSCTFVSLGAGGGQDVLQALQAGATEIHAVEVNKHINQLMTEGDLAEFSGNIYNDPRVKVVTEDGRAYVRRFENKFDIIYSLSSNSFAALASGAFALAENYLFTTEAFEDYWRSLTDHGFLMMEHQFYIPRLVTEARDALQNLGVHNPDQHIAVYNLPKMRRKFILLSKQPLNDELRSNAFGITDPAAPNHHPLIYPAPDSLQDNLINLIMTKGWEVAADSAAIDLSPATDNRPFTAQLGLWKNFHWDKLDKILPYEFFGFPLSKLIIIIILFVVVFFIIPLNLLPYLFGGDQLRAVPWLYFFTIGMAFMMVEVILMQKYALLIGPSVYSVATILLTLLISSGIGSRFADRVDTRIAFLGIIGWLLLDIFVFRQLIYPLGEFTLGWRIISSIALVAPLGFFMGMPFTKGTLKVGKLIDWGFAVNGAASVLGSVLIVLIAFSFGFAWALLLAAALYFVAFLLISVEKAW